jgi:hypothetical protein
LAPKASREVEKKKEEENKKKRKNERKERQAREVNAQVFVFIPSCSHSSLFLSIPPPFPLSL